jgi:hypothetical protein
MTAQMDKRGRDNTKTCEKNVLKRDKNAEKLSENKKGCGG